jgi:hypothetical protein
MKVVNCVPPLSGRHPAARLLSCVIVVGGVVLGLLSGSSASADVTLLNNRNTITLLYEVKLTKRVDINSEVFFFESEPIDLPTQNGPVMVTASVVDPRQFFPDPWLGSAMVTMTYHAIGFGFFTDNGLLSWSGVDGAGLPQVGQVRLPNSGDPAIRKPIVVLSSKIGQSPNLIAGPKPSQFRVIGGQDTVVRVRLMY